VADTGFELSVQPQHRSRSFGIHAAALDHRFPAGHSKE